MEQSKESGNTDPVGSKKEFSCGYAFFFLCNAWARREFGQVAQVGKIES